MQFNLQYYEFVVQFRYVNDFVQNTHLHIFPLALASESLCGEGLLHKSFF
jgi:hypothetical protein